MRSSRTFLVLVAAGSLLPFWLAFPSRAQNQNQSAPVGDPGRGERIALSCSRCHGETGVSTQAWIPNLAGMRQHVIYKQLEDYRSHRRRPEWYMAGIAQALSLQDSADVSAYYERQALGGATQPNGTVVPRSLASCATCHDARTGDAPQIAGQQPQYLEIQLSLFAQGIRTNDQGGIMQKVARGLSIDEIRRVSETLGRGSR